MADFEITLSVRDYECDIQGIVNNAVYQNYLEHARHLYLSAHGIDFVAYHRAGKTLVVTRAELDYLASLHAGEEAKITVSTETEGRVKLIFNQMIYRASDNHPVIRAKITGVCLVNNRPVRIQDLASQLHSSSP